MKKLVSLLAVLTLIVGSFGFIAQPASALGFNHVAFSQASTIVTVGVVGGDRRNEADEKLAGGYGQKIDLNNANVRLFRQYKGFYPNLASKIVKHAPYDKVEDVLSIPGLSETQKERLQANLENFTVTKPSSVFLEGDERLNNGNY